MKCSRQGCGADTFVLESRKVAGGAIVRRRRWCENYHRFTTYEMDGKQLPPELKKQLARRF